MTNRDIFFQVLSEATGIPTEKLVVPVDSFPNMKFFKELSDEEAEVLLGQLRRELPGIRAWYARQTLKATPPAGSA